MGKYYCDSALFICSRKALKLHSRICLVNDIADDVDLFRLLIFCYHQSLSARIIEVCIKYTLNNSEPKPIPVTVSETLTMIKIK